MIKESNFDISENGCWIWNGKKCSSGRYGYFYSNKKMILSHRASFEKFKEKIPDGMFVCHTCDNGLCVNPDHLFLGTNSDNMKDAYNKGRLNLNKILANQKGESNFNAKYNAEFIKSIRDYYSENKVSYSQLAKHFNLKSKGHAYSIVKRKIWGDI